MPLSSAYEIPQYLSDDDSGSDALTSKQLTHHQPLMSQTSDAVKDHRALSDLPPELLRRIVLFIGLDHVCTLRHIIVACRDSDLKCLAEVAESLLQGQRALLLERWKKINEKIPVLADSPMNADAIATSLIGKQYVGARDITDRTDEWVSLLAWTRYTSYMHFIDCGTLTV